MTMARDGKMATYEVVMPSDYLHILNCICIYKVNKTYKCYNSGDTWRAAATRLTADAYSQVLDNFWLKPTYKRPYYYIHNVNSSRDSWKSNSDSNNGESRGKINYATIPTNPHNASDGSGTDVSQVSDENDKSISYGTDGMNHNIVQGTGLPDTITVDINGTSTTASNRERGQGLRYGNVSQVRLEIRYGTDNSVFELTDVYVDYIKAPQNIRLTQEEIDTTEDISQMLEYPDYVCQEIINELVHLVMENISDQRLQTHPVVSQSIANPAQAQAPAASGQTA